MGHLMCECNNRLFPFPLHLLHTFNMLPIAFLNVSYPESCLYKVAKDSMKTAFVVPQFFLALLGTVQKQEVFGPVYLSCHLEISSFGFFPAC